MQRKIYTVGFSIGRKTNCVRMQVFFAKKIFKLNFVKSNILVRYIAKELLLYFLICFVFFFVVFFVNQILLLAETILKKRVPVNSVLKLILYCLPNVISQSAPFATLVGFLMCLGRLVTDNEILIFRASGQRYSLILKSVLAMGFLISVFSFIMNDYFLPIGTLKYNRLFKQIIVSNPAIELESKSIKRMNDSTLVIGNVNKNNVSDIVLFDSEKNGVQRIIMAENSDVKKSSAPGVIMQLDMNSPVVLSLDKSEVKNYESISAEKLRLNIFEDSIISSSNGTSPREMTSWDLIKRIKKMKQENSSTKKRLNTFILECNKKFSVPFGSFFFALLAFPLALIFGKKDGQTLGLIFGIILSVLYWSATIIGQMFGIRGGYNGFWMMWTPNFVIGILGIILYIRLKKK
ncbi:LptF/LptG family permease [uncultured Treponema sp.]|uniref:LptF/LptG family permease n=2 Tax=uncultured Treponema sp. TaxID=162155 RepID=UPI0025E06721|nr:LptF/LptG family permease [uncultured Treponema sp.]